MSEEDRPQTPQTPPASYAMLEDRPQTPPTSVGSYAMLEEYWSLQGTPATIQRHLDAAAHPDSCDESGMTVLMNCAVKSEWSGFTDDIAIARTMLKAGADPNARDFSGRTALDHATATNHQDMLVILLAAGAAAF